MNFIQLIFSLLTSGIIIYSNLISFLEPKLPRIFSEAIRYGKFAAPTKSKLILEVPKSWFKHFYIMALVEYTFLLWLVTVVYVFDMQVPEYVKSALDLICGKERIAYIPKSKVFVAVLLMTLQVYRRFYECLWVSVFAEKARMNISHYIFGLIHYPGAILAIICEAPLFSHSPVSLIDEPLNLLSISLSEKIAVLVFLWAWIHQYICTKILADLRKNKDGEVVSNEYKLPQGDWFKYLSSPHQTAEVMMYTSLMWILCHNVSYFFVFTWVLANQASTILLSHWWYQSKFEDFPKTRKALIPFVY